MKVFVVGNLFVFTYHYVRNIIYKNPGIHPVSLDQFNKDIKQLKRSLKFYNTEYYFEDTKLNEHDFFSITFDDGIIDQSKDVLNILNENKIKGIFFINSRPYVEKIPNIVNKFHWIRSNFSQDHFAKEFTNILKSLDISIENNISANAQLIHKHDNKDVAIIKYLISTILPNNTLEKLSDIFLDRLNVSNHALCEQIYIDKDTLVEMHNEGHAIELHGHSHYMYSRLNNDDMKLDLNKNIDFLKKLIGKKEFLFAYPYGRANAIPDDQEDLFQLFQSNNVRKIFTLNSSKNILNNNLIVDRFTNNEIDSLFQ